MPAGDAQRVWFPEMIERLRAEWGDGLSFPSLIELRDTLEIMLRGIRSDRFIRPPIFKCPVCGNAGPAAEPRISVRAIILTLARFRISSGEQAKTLKRAWAAYRKENQLDLYGKPTAIAQSSGNCVHLNVR
jgi:hypothetical protein